MSRRATGGVASRIAGRGLLATITFVIATFSVVPATLGQSEENGWPGHASRTARDLEVIEGDAGEGDVFEGNELAPDHRRLIRIAKRISRAKLFGCREGGPRELRVACSRVPRLRVGRALATRRIVHRHATGFHRPPSRARAATSRWTRSRGRQRG